ncbi:DUF2778 domain-containing protein [Rhizobium sp. PAMB 3174]
MSFSMAFATDYYPAKPGFRLPVLPALPRLMSGAAFVGGTLAVGLWVSATLGALHGISSTSSGRSEDFRTSLLLAAPRQPAGPTTWTRYSRPANRATGETLAALKTPDAQSLDTSGRTIVKQALVADIAERALGNRWASSASAKDGDTQLAAAETTLGSALRNHLDRKITTAALANAQTPGALVSGLPPALKSTPAQIAAAAAQPSAVELAMLPDAVPAPMVRPKQDPFNEVLSAGNAKAVAEKGDASIPLKTAPQKTGPKTLLAYARPDEPMDDADVRPSLLRKQAALPGPGSKVAVYDITAQTVYMPDGRKLVAHSGRGKMRDKPKYISVNSWGPTPPNVYRLSKREALFHGVEALRMTPVGGEKMYGRNGFLTHSYLRRVPGDSAGCIAFANYPTFLAAYKRGEVKTVIVVPSIDELPRYMAML